MYNTIVKKMVGVLSSLERLGKCNTLSQSDLPTSEKSDRAAAQSVNFDKPGLDVQKSM